MSGLLLSLVTAMSTAATPEVSASPEADWQAWRAARVLRLRREDGWLALVGLHWLEEGENRVSGLPGVWSLSAGEVTLVAAATDGWTLDGAPVTSRHLGAQRLHQGTRQLQVIARSGKVALRVWDAASPRRVEFPGVDAFPYQARWRVEATFEAYPVPREVETPSVVNLPQKELAPGRVHFVLDGKPCSLEPTQEKPGQELSFVFKDLTSRTDTYGAGRFLSAEAPREGKVVLDFNRASNPPCAFTEYATCPLPRPENLLSVRIEAGEKRPAGH